MSENKKAVSLNKDQKFQIILGLYVGFWGMLQVLTVKLVPLDLTWLGLGVLGFSFGSIAHALTFPCTDAVAEVWGAKRARSLVYLGIGVYALSTLLIYIATKMPSAEGWPHHDSYNAIFAGAPRIILASLVATVFAQIWDIYVFEWVKRKTGERMLWLRNNLSTWGSQLADTSLFYTIAFYGIIPNEVLPTLILGTYLLKISIAAIDTPVVYLTVRWITGSWTANGDLEKKSAQDALNGD